MKNSGYIYIMHNPKMPDIVKIGYADDVEKRRKQLSRPSNIPVPYKVYATYEVKERLSDISLHKLICDINPELRINDNKEFFDVSPEKAFEWLQAIAKISHTENRLKLYKAAENKIVNTTGNKKITPNMQARKKFWDSFSNSARNNSLFMSEFTLRKTNTDHWMNFAAGSSKAHFSVSQLRKYDQIVIELWIPDDKSLFDKLYSNKAEIEKTLGFCLDWRRLDDKKASRILIEKNDCNLNDLSKQKDNFNWIFEKLIKMKKAFDSYLHN